MHNVAVIGAGVWAENHRIGWQARDDARITCVVSSSDEGAQHGAALGGRKLERRLARGAGARRHRNLDILLPHDLHAEVAIAALERGKHIVLEKPLATTVADAERPRPLRAADALR